MTSEIKWRITSSREQMLLKEWLSVMVNILGRELSLCACLAKDNGLDSSMILKDATVILLEFEE